MKYNYIIVQPDADYYHLIAQKTNERKEATVVNGLLDSSSRLVKKIIYRLYASFESHRHFGLSRLLSPFILKCKFPKDKPLCFVFMAWYANDVNKFLGQVLRKKYPGCKLVCRFEDIIEKMPYNNIEEYRDAFDMLTTFDSGDARKYDISYFPSWYDSVDIEDDSSFPESDVLFVAKGKDRMPEIIAAFEKLDGAGLDCAFYLVDVPEEERVHADKIHYCDYVPYADVLKMVKRTKCILEIMQKGGEGETLRVYEAITYGKKLISNNMLIKERDYYSPEKIQCYSNVDELDPDFIRQEPTEVFYDEFFIKRLNPINMLMDIDNQISPQER